MTTIAHTPHEVFVELHELQKTYYGGLEWKEQARWIKYEEAIEGADNRWGKPQVSFLSFNALFSLKKELEKGCVLLDLAVTDLTVIVTKVVEQMITCRQIPVEHRQSMIKILLLKHHHIREGSSVFKRFHHLGVPEDGYNGPSPTHSRSSLRSSKRSLSSLFHGNTVSPIILTDDSDSGRITMAQLEKEETVDEKEEITLNTDLRKALSDDAEAVAVLVGSLDFLTQPVLAFVRLAEATYMKNFVEVPVPARFMFYLLGPYDDEIDYLEVGRCFSTLMSEKSFRQEAYSCQSKNQLLRAINDFMNASVVFPPSTWASNDLVPLDKVREKVYKLSRKNEESKAKLEDLEMPPKSPVITKKQQLELPEPKHERDPLARKGKLFYGLIQDVKIRYAQYLTDFRDGFSPQVLSASIFIFFAALSPAITFGGIYDTKTSKYIGVGETLLAASINGIVFALFAAQPILIVGSTGPLMIFDMSLLNFCRNMNVDYLSTRVWVGIWILVIGLLVAAFELVSVVKKFTRFTEEIFSTLVCIIFIYGAFENLAAIFLKHPLTSLVTMVELNNNITKQKSLYEILTNGTQRSGDETESVPANQPNTALLSSYLMLGTFIIAWKLKKFRNSQYLSQMIRRCLGDFGVPLAIFLMVLLDYLLKDIHTDKLTMPQGLQPSNSEIRGWLINPLGMVKPLPIWCIFAAAPAALLLFILIFIEENICHLILGKPERCLKKGSGYHLDIVLSCLINTIAGFIGAPFMGPACVRTIAHMSALTIFDTNVPPGETPKIVGCIEQRVSALFVSILIGLAVMLYAVLNLVPTAVLLGIFLYMGVSATAGIQLLERVALFFMPRKYHPSAPYVRHVTTRKMYMFTVIQVIMLVVLWLLTQSPASLAVPFVLLMLIPLRMYLLPCLFTHDELVMLDGSQKVPELERAEEGLDIYEIAHTLPDQMDSSDLHEH